ncbi:MAG TPA: alpha/beta hydrolase [Chitinophagaceae bacterium]|nr:alpha/beta hydrolase [Chitinophagaceae bacterium]
MVTLFGMSIMANAQTILPLYEKEIPGAINAPDLEKTDTGSDGIVRVSAISIPTIAVYLPDKKIATGTAVIIFPGGGYHINAIKHEGWDLAKYFIEKGIAAFVVKYRIPDSNTMLVPETGPLMDAQQAITHVRTNAAKYGINPSKVGVMGFSAGGHLAANASTLYRYNANAKALRPDFSLLIYPVISFSDSITHSGSKSSLLGKNPSPEKVKLYSNEMQVDSNTPPAFLVHAKDDGVSYRNSLVYEEALKKNNVPVKLLLYEKGGHGYGMYNKQSDIFWPDEMIKWMRAMGY